uniref:Uncharacterized protein n=1 Tax=Meleagris gallopavo TaxID=9103 RepID=A0A803YE17_MELGA
MQFPFHPELVTAGLIKKGPKALGACGGRGQHSLLPIGQQEGEVFLPKDSQAQSDIYCIYRRDQTHTQMSHFSNSISRSDKQSLERGHCRQKVQDGGPFPPRLLSPPSHTGQSDHHFTATHLSIRREAKPLDLRLLQK